MKKVKYELQFKYRLISWNKSGADDTLTKKEKLDWAKREGVNYRVVKIVYEETVIYPKSKRKK